MVSPEALRRFPNFAGVPEERLKQIAAISHEKAFKAGERVFTEGNLATHFMLLKSGEIHVVYLLGNGDKVIADTLVTGDPMAWSSLLPPHRLTASGEASKDGTLISIEAESLRRLCEEDKEFGFVMMREIGKTLRSRLSAMRVQAAASLAEPVAG
jgi:CRP-like cAMP-binding protein